MSIEKDRDRLLQARMLSGFRRDSPLTELITVYFSGRDYPSNHGVHCVLIRSDRITRALARPVWDLMHGGGVPGAVTHYEDRGERVEYFRFGSDDGIEPLIIEREFHGLRKEYLEISEEFRLFHKLYHERKSDKYFKIDDAGRDHLVAVVTVDRVQVRLKEIRQFLAIKEMHLSIQFDCKEYSRRPLEELGLERGGADQRDSLSCWGLHFGETPGLDKYRTWSRLLGKRLISPLPKSKSGFPGFADESEEKHVDFIVGLDENGEEVTETSSRIAPGYLTPIHFRKQVLDKYYLEPSRYSVEDSILRCGRLWDMSIDNHHDDRVCAWLGDLGRDLPYEEQLHWRSYNIPPDGGVSRTYLSRQILAQFTDSDRPEHLFGLRYAELSEACQECLGWQLLLPLGDNDQHHLQCMRIPTTNEQREFDELVLGLTKILVDSLNEKQLNQLIPPEHREGMQGSITRLEAAFEACDVQDASGYISFLRKLQGLRSSSAAHRKGSSYRRVAEEFGVEVRDLREVFSGILWQALDLLDFFALAVRSGQLSGAARTILPK